MEVLESKTFYCGNEYSLDGVGVDSRIRRRC